MIATSESCSCFVSTSIIAATNLSATFCLSFSDIGLPISKVIPMSSAAILAASSTLSMMLSEPFVFIKRPPTLIQAVSMMFPSGEITAIFEVPPPVSI